MALWTDEVDLNVHYIYLIGGMKSIKVITISTSSPFISSFTKEGRLANITVYSINFFFSHSDSPLSESDEEHFMSQSWSLGFSFIFSINDYFPSMEATDPSVSTDEVKPNVPISIVNVTGCRLQSDIQTGIQSSLLSEFVQLISSHLWKWSL